MDEKVLVLIDGNSLINRAFFALPPLTDKQGRPSQAVYGFTTMLLKAVTDLQPTHMAVAFDLPAPTFRHKLYDGYKASRRGMPEELAVQLPILKELLRIMHVKIIEREGFEADDIIGTMAKTNPVRTYILTGDRDSFQLIDDTTTVLLTKRGLTDTARMDEEALKTQMGLTPAQIIDYKALAGDASDEIPGVTGIGDKTAVKLLTDYGSLDGIYEHLDALTGSVAHKLDSGRASAYLSRQLATIVTDMDLGVRLEECGFQFPFSGQVREYLRELDFKSLVKRGDLYGDYASVSDEHFDARKAPARVKLTQPQAVIDVMRPSKEIAFYCDENAFFFAYDPDTEYEVGLKYDLIDGKFDFEDCAQLFAAALADRDVVKVVFDVKKFKQRLYGLGLELNNFFDVRLAQYIADMSVPHEKADSILEHYGAGAAYASGLLYVAALQRKELERSQMHRLFYDVEQPLVDVLLDMERQGFRLDTEMCRTLGKRYQTELTRLSFDIYRAAGKEFNINSPRQLSDVLFRDLGIDYPKRTTRYSTSAEILEQIADRHEIVPMVMRYRLIYKLNSTYVEGLMKLADSGSRVHTEFRQMSTATGRLSSVEPNLQNIPVREEEGRALRGLFSAGEGKTLVSADYSQIELRLLAHFSMDKRMVTAYMNGDDIHTSTAAEVFGVARADVTPEMRRKAKAVNFGIIYGMSDFGLAESIKVPQSEAKLYKERYFARFEGVKRYQEDSVERAKKSGCAITLLGRVRRIPELFSPQFTVRQFGERVAMNMPLQGSAADIIKIAMLNVVRALEGMQSKLILQIHDELIVEAADDEVEQVKAIVKESMEHAVELNVPLTVEVSAAKNWLECKA